MRTLIAIAGSPREGANSDRLLDSFLEGARRAGARVERYRIRDMDIAPCRGCGECEKRGECVIEDDHPPLAKKIQEADLLVLASPVYYCGYPGMTKNFIDRFQANWSRRYFLKRPRRKGPRGFLISVGGAKAPENFAGQRLTFKYLMRSVYGESVGHLAVSRVDGPGAVLNRPEALKEAERAGYEFTNSE